MNERGRRNDSGSSLADSVQRVRQNQVTVLWGWDKRIWDEETSSLTNINIDTCRLRMVHRN